MAGEEPLDVGPAVGPGALSADPLLDRVYTFLVSAIGQMFNGVDADRDAGAGGARLRRARRTRRTRSSAARSVTELLRLRRAGAGQGSGAPAEPGESAPRARQHRARECRS